jgi:hypothetical protein
MAQNVGEKCPQKLGDLEMIEGRLNERLEPLKKRKDILNRVCHGDLVSAFCYVVINLFDLHAVYVKATEFIIVGQRKKNIMYAEIGEGKHAGLQRVGLIIVNEASLSAQGEVKHIAFGMIPFHVIGGLWEFVCHACQIYEGVIVLRARDKIIRFRARVEIDLIGALCHTASERFILYRFWLKKYIEQTTWL